MARACCRSGLLEIAADCRVTDRRSHSAREAGEPDPGAPPPLSRTFQNERPIYGRITLATLDTLAASHIWPAFAFLLRSDSLRASNATSRVARAAIAIEPPMLRIILKSADAEPLSFPASMPAVATAESGIIMNGYPMARTTWGQRN